MNIAILTPSRIRPDGLFRLFESLNNTISSENDIELMVGLDLDDPLLNGYFDLLAVMKTRAKENFQINTVVSGRKPLAAIWNSLADLSNADWSMCGNDDDIYLTPGWDKILVEKIKGNHPYNLYWFDDGLQHGNHCAFPILSKEWINTVGYFFPEIFIHNYVDTWVYDIACKLRVANYIPEVKHQHLHYSLRLSPLDQTYIDGMAENSNDIDREMFRNTAGERMKIVELLKSKICQLKDYSL